MRKVTVYKVFTIRKNIYKLRITLKKMKYLIVIKLFFLIMWYHIVPLGGNGLKWLSRTTSLKYNRYEDDEILSSSIIRMTHV